ncbi:HlyD family secretion protein [Agrobacterium tumefaciens]|uniref:HlyD family secretion protein n=1 Tax=Agrobacterium tumefaciens TaxID=358 RepID=A0AA44F6A4_AGRTU|nr:HlyD family secretion protein [Agrobacterium tumefaciens]NTB87541.1 HlyD family secretion protein [Agrobacterium tumefaciens]NTC17526.1 HlyD family secretion protein [Agrobacterium tumefaciens]NTC29692.1 HlyD family secretion protein [Agrobacterium tumefaciens]
MSKYIKPIFFTSCAAIVAVFCAAVIVRAYFPSAAIETNDAYVTADYVVVAPRISGVISEVLVDDNTEVKAGQVLARIDFRDQQVAQASAEAAVAQANANVANLRAQLDRIPALIEQAKAMVKADDANIVFATADLDRIRNLSRTGSNTIRQLQQGQSTLDNLIATRVGHQAAVQVEEKQMSMLRAEIDGAIASQKSADASAEQAKLNLSYTNITAPEDGVVGSRSARVGAYVGPGTALMAVVPLKKAYIVASYREVELENVRPGQAVDVHVDSMPGHVFTGVVESLAPATGATFSAIAPGNATGNFTKVVQRLPVKIRLNTRQPGLDGLRAGMSVTTVIATDQSSTATADNAGRARQGLKDSCPTVEPMLAELAGQHCRDHL